MRSLGEDVMSLVISKIRRAAEGSAGRLATPSRILSLMLGIDTLKWCALKKNRCEDRIG
jgi:hypothetical protein